MFRELINRRQMLGVSAGMGLSFSLPALDLFAANQRGKERPISLITLWMDGGQSQLETWDPHPGGDIGGDVKSISTKMNGLKISNLLPNMAEQIHHLSVIRSLVSKEGDHERATAFVKTGYRPEPTTVYPALGAVIAEYDEENPVQKMDIPRHVSLGGGQWPARGGYLGDRFDAFRVFNPGNNIQNMKARVKDKRQKTRLNNLEVLSNSFQMNRKLQTEKTLHQHSIERALAMMSSDQLEAFKIDKETDKTKKSYGDTQFGRGCLVARRLVETGVRAVEVSLSGHDSHANNHETQKARANDLDPAFAQLVADLVERDLYDSTIVLCISEFGRTPRINPVAGRDHWPTGFSCVIGGGGLKSGLLIGETDPEGVKKQPTDPITIQDLYATILEKIGIDYTVEKITPIGRPIMICEGTPIDRLLG